MDERIVQFRVGVVVLATLIITAILIVVFSERSPFEPYVTYEIVFPQAPGVTIDTPVRKSGILVGRVKEIRFTDEGQVMVWVDIREKVDVRRNEVFRIKPSLLGDATVELVPVNDPNAPRDLVPPGEVLAGVVVQSPVDILANMQGDLQEAVSSLGNAGKGVADLADRLNNFFDDKDSQIDRVMDKAELALDTFNSAVGKLDSTLGDEELNQRLRKTLEDLPTLMAEARETMAGLQRAATSAEQNFENLKGFTGPLGDRGDEMITRAESAVANLDDLLSQFVAFGKALNSSEGSLGQIINNPDLYQRLNRAAANIQEATERLRPIMNDIRVFTDKIARQPGQLGVRGAIKPGAPIK